MSDRHVKLGNNRTNATARMTLHRALGLMLLALAVLTVTMPSGAQARAKAKPSCVVPKLTGDSLATARTRLTSAHCKLGAVHDPAGEKGKTLVVSSTSPKAGRRERDGTKVAVTLKVKKTTTKATTTTTTTTAAVTPVLAVHLDPAFVQNPLNSLEVTYTYSASATIGGAPDGSLPAGVLEFFSDGLLACSTNVGGGVDGGTCEVTYTSYGTHTTNVIYDSGTNSATTGTQTETISFIPPTIPPTLSGVPANITTTATSAAGAVVHFTPPSATDALGGSASVACSIPSGATAPVGVSSDVCTATDAYGNTTKASFTIDVEAPTTPPTLQNVPSDMTVAPATASGTDASFVTPTATDVFGNPATVDCSTTPGTLIAPGTTITDTCTATDVYGNQASGSFTITVQPVELTFSVSYDTSTPDENGDSLPSELSIPMIDDDGPGGDTPGAALFVYPTVSGNITSDPDPSGAISATITPTPWETDDNGTIISGPTCAAIIGGNGCGWYIDTTGDYTVTVTFASSDPNYADTQDQASSDVEITPEG